MSTEIFSSKWTEMSAVEQKEVLKQYVGDVDLYIVCLDDQPSLLEIIADKINELGFKSFGTTNPDEALEFIQTHQSTILLIISDFKMPSMDGFEFRQKVQIKTPDIPFAILSGYVDREMALRGIDLKIASFLQKPISDESLFDLLKKETTTRILTIKEDRELLSGFTDEALKLIGQLEELILGLEENPQDQDAIAKIFGTVHTIKGSSGFFQPRILHTFTHRFEDVLKEVQHGSIQVNEDIVSIMLKACDIMKYLIEEFVTGNHKFYELSELTQIFQSIKQKGKKSGANATEHIPIETTKQKGPEELKVTVNLLDEFMQISGEMTVIRNMINKVVRSIEKQYPSDKDVLLLNELLGEMHKINSSVQSKISEIRKVPVRNVVKPLTRIIRDTSQALSKEVELKLTGEDIRVDTSVAGVLSNSLIHLIRNSLDHGIEKPDARIQAGKVPKGEVQINTRIQGENIIVEIKDDGKGINPESIKNKLISNGSHTAAEIESMSQAELFQMIFAPGFSTAQQITDISGRGVGMSMVKDVVEAIGGQIIINSVLGKGTQFTLNIPIPKSVLITNCLFLTAKISTRNQNLSDMQFGIPQDQIKRIINVQEALDRDLIYSLEGTKVLRVDEHIIPILHLEEILAGHFKTVSKSFETGYLVLIDSSLKLFCLWVDSVLDVEDTVVKTITAGQIKNTGLYMGATFLGDGTIGLILNMDGIASKSDISKETFKNTKITKSSEAKDESKKIEVLQNYVLCEIINQSMYAIPQEWVFRLEEFNTSQFQQSGNNIVAPYRNGIISFINLELFFNNQDQVILLSPTHSTKDYTAIVIKHKNNYIGLLVDKVLELFSSNKPLEPGIFQQPGCEGWLFHGDRPIISINIKQIIEMIINNSLSENQNPQLQHQPLVS